MCDKPRRSPKSGRSQLDQGFDRYLIRELHGLYDPVLNQELPDELAKLAELFESRPEPAKEVKPEPDKPAAAAEAGRKKR